MIDIDATPARSARRPGPADNFAPEFIWGRYVDFFEVGRVKGEPFKYAGSWVSLNGLSRNP